MRVITRFLAKLESFFFRERAERDLAREIDAHLALLQDDFEGRGMTPEEARRAARRAYGGVEQAKELHRDERSFVWLEQLLQDLQHACRGLIRNPGFTAVALIALALGIGVNATLFSAYNAAALKPLPVADPDHVVRFKRWHRGGGWSVSQFGFSYAEYVHCRDHSDQFSSLVAASVWLVSALGSLPGSGATERLSGQLVSANYFPGLGIRPLRGRGFLAEEDRTPGANPVVVVSYRFWKHRFEGDPRVLGRTIRLTGTAFTIVGITPENFTGTSIDTPAIPDFWAPLSMQAQLVPGQDWLNQPDQQNFQIFARLRPSTALKTAQAQADLLVHQLDATHAEGGWTTGIKLQPTTYFPNTDAPDFQAAVAAVMLIPGLVLLVACANVGNMLLARGAARQREISTRLALGASRGRVVRHLLTESVLLSGLGGLIGLLITVWSTKLLAIYLQQIAGEDLGLDFAPDIHVVAYALAVSLVAGVVFGLSPALQLTKRDLTVALKDEGAGLGNLRGSWLRSFLIAAQVAVSMFLLASAGLLTRGLVRSLAADPGFETRHVFVVDADFAPHGDHAKAIDRKRLLAAQLRERPELGGGALGGHPLNGGEWYPPAAVGHFQGQVTAGFASDTYLAMLGIPVLRGRNFTAKEAASGAPIAIVSESTARRFWPNKNPLGKHFTLDMDPDFGGAFTDFEVIGIVRDVRFDNPTRIDPTHVYLPAGGPGSRRVALTHHSTLEVLVRFQGNRQRALSAVETTIEVFDKNLFPSLRLINVEDDDARPQRAMSQLLAMMATLLAVLAATLAGIGIYGVIAYLVSQRTREIGIRMALGANSGAVLKNVILQGLRPVFAGLIVGLAAAAGLSSVLHWALVFPEAWDPFYGVPFYDPVTFGGMLCFVLLIAACASAVPARRALRVDPMTALRYE